jgi:hypothetical protein
MIGAMFSRRHVTPVDKDGYRFIDRDGTHFRHILNFLRDPEGFSLTLSANHKAEMLREVDYYGLGDLMQPFFFVPAQSFTQKSNFNTAGGGAQTLTISQTETGMWQMDSSSYPSVFEDAIVCDKCNAAYISDPRYTASHGDSYSVGIKNFLNSTRSLVDPDQPKPVGACKHCKK